MTVLKAFPVFLFNPITWKYRIRTWVRSASTTWTRDRLTGQWFYTCTDYTYSKHLQWMAGWIESLGLSDITLLAQDWGGRELDAA